MKKLSLVLLGFIPIPIGFLMNYLIVEFSIVVSLLSIISIVFLLLWGFLGFCMGKKAKNPFPSLLLIHLPAFFMVSLIMYQQIVLGHYFGNILGYTTQFYFLPILTVAFSLSFWSIHMWVTYLVAFLLMCLAYYLGFKFKYKRKSIF